MKKNAPWLAVLAACLGLWLLLPRWTGAEVLDLGLRLRIYRELRQAESLTGQDRQTVEAELAEAGFSVLDSDPVYPTFLANPEALRAFYGKARDGKRASVSIFRVLEDGSIRHLCFSCRDGEVWFDTTDLGADGKPEVTQRLPVLDMELCDWDVFYYRCYPAGDPHYVDYSQIRLTPADREAYDLARTYILPIGYQMVNLFLTDWQEGDWEAFGLSDTLEFLYGKYDGRPLPWEGWEGSTSCIWVPGEVFEATILPHFAISRDRLRSVCSYDPVRECYPWKPIHGDDLTTWGYPMCEPEVVSWQENEDGTVTMEVWVRSGELKSDRLFSHILTVRPGEDGFQYVSNRVSYVGDRGLPVAKARFELHR